MAVVGQTSLWVRSCSAAAATGEGTSPLPPRCSQVDTVLVAACTAVRYREVYPRGVVACTIYYATSAMTQCDCAQPSSSHQ